MNLVFRDQAAIHYEMYGKGDTTLVFVHGAFINQTFWKKQVEYFAHHYQVVTLDLPGHGVSGKERETWSVDGYADDVVAILKAINRKKVILIGHSFAADICLMAAEKYPDHIIGIVGVDTLKNAGSPLPVEWQSKVMSMLDLLQTDFDSAMDQYANMAVISKDTPAEISTDVVSAFRNAYPRMAKAILPEIMELFRKEKAILPAWHSKLYLLNVDNVPTNEEKLKQYAAGGYEVWNMGGTSHYPMVENPEKFNHMLQQIVQNILVNQKVNADGNEA
jgi:sigma-B regulation protein RsbQ